MRGDGGGERLQEARAQRLAGEAINAFNHVIFNVPDLNPRSAAFGTVSGQVNLPRYYQLGLRLTLAELAAQHPEAFVARAYDDPLVIEGNSTLAAELAALRLELDVVVAPLGGGGLTAGLVLGAQRARARFEVIDAEPLSANDAARSFRAGCIIANDNEPQTIADGVRTISLGEHNWALLKHHAGG